MISFYNESSCANCAREVRRRQATPRGRSTHGQRRQRTAIAHELRRAERGGWAQLQPGWRLVGGMRSHQVYTCLKDPSVALTSQWSVSVGWSTHPLALLLAREFHVRSYLVIIRH